MSQIDSNDPANGSAWAAILASGIGCFAYGVMIDLGEATKLGARLLNFYDPVGNLSGKTIVAVLVWVVGWIDLHIRWRGREIASTRAITALTLILVFLGIAASCPLVFELLTGK